MFIFCSNDLFYRTISFFLSFRFFCLNISTCCCFCCCWCYCFYCCAAAAAADACLLPYNHNKLCFQETGGITRLWNVLLFISWCCSFIMKFWKSYPWRLHVSSFGSNMKESTSSTFMWYGLSISQSAGRLCCFRGDEQPTIDLTDNNQSEKLKGFSVNLNGLSSV